MASSDSDDSISPLAEKVSCILSCSSSSSEESADDISEGMHVSHGDAMSQLESEHPEVLDRVKTLYTEGKDKVCISTSLMKDLGIKHRSSAPVLCDICIVSRRRPVTLLSFVKDTEILDKHLKYNTKIARFMVSEVREHLFGSFSLVSGVINLKSCKSKELFTEEIQSLDEDAKLCSVPGWLHMNDGRYERLVNFIDKLRSKVFDEGQTMDPISPSFSLTLQTIERKTGVDRLAKASTFETESKSVQKARRNAPRKREMIIPSKTRSETAKVRRTSALSSKFFDDHYSTDQDVINTRGQDMEQKGRNISSELSKENVFIKKKTTSFMQLRNRYPVKASWT